MHLRKLLKYFYFFRTIMGDKNSFVLGDFLTRIFIFPIFLSLNPFFSWRYDC